MGVQNGCSDKNLKSYVGFNFVIQQVLYIKIHEEISVEPILMILNLSWNGTEEKEKSRRDSCMQFYAYNII